MESGSGIWNLDFVIWGTAHLALTSLIIFVYKKGFGYYSWDSEDTFWSLAPIACSPLGLPVTAAVFVGYLLWVAGKLVWRTIVMVHSDIRLLCLVDSALGASAGYLAGNAVVGGVSGAILGLVNYQLISVRLLKLVPGK